MAKKSQHIDRELFALRIAQNFDPAEAYWEAGGTIKDRDNALKAGRRLKGESEVKAMIDDNIAERIQGSLSSIAELTPKAVSIISEVLSQDLTPKNQNSMLRTAQNVLELAEKYMPQRVEITHRDANIDLDKTLAELMEMLNEQPQFAGQIESLVGEQPRDVSASAQSIDGVEEQQAESVQAPQETAKIS